MNLQIYLMSFRRSAFHLYMRNLFQASHFVQGRDIVLRIIIEYSSLRDFAPLKLGEMIHPNLVVKIFTFIF